MTAVPAVLVGDVGGTRARLALARAAGARVRLEGLAVFPSPEFPGLEAIVAAYLARTGARPAAACLGVAGPVRGERVTATNLPWVVDAAEVARAAGLTSAVTLLNDLEATAWGVAALEPEAVAPLQAGAPGARGNAAVIAAGTGLGEAGLLWDGERHRPFATEGGHASFAPGDETQAALYRFLARELGGHVSAERVVSGPGLHNVYRFLRAAGAGEEPPWLAAALAAGDPAAAISAAALEGRSALCAQALDLFVRAYGAEAGNLALKTMATGGVWVAGGIAPRILDRLRAPEGFLEAFRAKGRLRPLLEAIPVAVVLDDRVGLLGAARRALLAGA